MQQARVEMYCLRAGWPRAGVEWVIMIGWWCSWWRIRDLVIIVDVLGLVEMDGGRAVGTRLLVWLLMLQDLL